MDATRLRQRSQVLWALRSWFQEQGYLEVQTPLLVPAGAMEEHLEPISLPPFQLHTSPEFAMKRVLAEGLGRIYQICACFREEEVGCHHSREFTMLEWYRSNAGTPELMDELQDLVGRSAEALGATPPRFERIPTDTLLDPTLPSEEWFYRWVHEVEPKLPPACIVYAYPAAQAALARVVSGRADRFEAYLHGIELANAFAEETDPQELRRRSAASAQARLAMGRQPHPEDPRFFAAVGRMPRCAGIALGLDRLLMALTAASHIHQVQAD